MKGATKGRAGEFPPPCMVILSQGKVFAQQAMRSGRMKVREDLNERNLKRDPSGGLSRFDFPFLAPGGCWGEDNRFGGGDVNDNAKNDGLSLVIKRLATMRDQAHGTIGTLQAQLNAEFLLAAEGLLHGVVGRLAVAGDK